LFSYLLKIYEFIFYYFVTIFFYQIDIIKLLVYLEVKCIVKKWYSPPSATSCMWILIHDIKSITDMYTSVMILWQCSSWGTLMITGICRLLTGLPRSLLLDLNHQAWFKRFNDWSWFKIYPKVLIFTFSLCLKYWQISIQMTEFMFVCIFQMLVHLLVNILFLISGVMWTVSASLTEIIMCHRISHSAQAWILPEYIVNIEFYTAQSCFLFTVYIWYFH